MCWRARSRRAVISETIAAVLPATTDVMSLLLSIERFVHEEAEQQENHEQREEDEEQDLRNGRGTGGDAREAEHAGHDGDERENDCPLEHDISPELLPSGEKGW